MMCLSPIRLRQKVTDAFDGAEFEKRYGKRKQKYAFIDVPCGKCLACLSRRKQDWMFRLKQELSNSFGSVFVTLTYDEEHLPRSYIGGVPTLVKRELQLFLKRLRKSHVTPIRYFAIGEYGPQTYRPHYHLILFNCRPDIGGLIHSSWPNGNIKVDEVSGARVNYICKYVCIGGVDEDLFAFLDEHRCERPFMVCSKRPYIGSCFVTPAMERYFLSNDTLSVTVDGYRQNIPRIYRNKIFGDVHSSRLGASVQEELQAKMREEADKEIAEYGSVYHCKMELERKLDYNRKVKNQFKLNRKL